ncbi:hypothetical protein AGABI1DRAFT_119074 [Agaricus bisporus var. burnettii JB137-S8]|uniref:UAA transporter n=1 Tax=Agaricus bisporus var. burnettii (strain JB137-S8 / ATCC MYA-4627 / FGSC 10392) TaxID=597362 RepID=K5XFE4_AGABU|nr:uncharacterized protein AGABI1DRAFT_119074 [Agaricus bisporus var. burnettii JB137-S8]EKM82103.1 hypothetical protein AGABI1DRAFT_119074 [Agaricus bisporus var. burnettii JB137-S8]
MSLDLLCDWSTTLGFVFGGCCSNAVTLEQLTSQYPNAGSLITLFQFLIITLHGLPRHLTWTPTGPRFKPRRIPLTPYFVQVGLFYFLSLLNNIAFGYDIPMSVHIIFRSGGLIVSMCLGWLIRGKRYNSTQVSAVLLVTLGVFLTTLSATPSSSLETKSDDTNMWSYMIGISILSFALILSGLLGLAQDWTYSTYGRPLPSTSNSTTKTNDKQQPPQWQESLFYLHFLSLPMFFLLRQDLQTQFHEVSNGPRVFIPTNLALPNSLSSNSLISNSSFISFTPSPYTSASSSTTGGPHTLSFHIPYAYTPLLLNTLTQVLCASGVHRLTTRVSSLTVTLVLVIRKAVSLVLSVLGAGIIPGVGGGKVRNVDQGMMWTGAAFVLVGTILYSMGTGGKNWGGGAKAVEKGKKE